MSIHKPHIFREGEYTSSDLQSFSAAHDIQEVTDIYKKQLGEYFDISHPQFLHTSDYEMQRQAYVSEHITNQDLRGSWVYYPWSRRFVHMIGEDEYCALRTNRNRDLITVEEYKTLSRKKVGIVGLSIGSTIARVVAMTGAAGSMTLAEYDTLDSTNMNRLFARVDQIGTSKVDILKQQLYEFDPYLHLNFLEGRLTPEAARQISLESDAPDIWIDAIDDIPMKIELRKIARTARIPVLMVTSLGDDVLVDIERFDLEPERPLFHGRLDDVIEEVDTTNLSEEKKHEYAVRVVGRDAVPERAIESVKKIGSELVGRPQLMSTVSVAGGIAATVVRDIFLDKTRESGRTLIRFSDFFSQTHT